MIRVLSRQQNRQTYLGAALSGFVLCNSVFRCNRGGAVVECRPSASYTSPMPPSPGGLKQISLNVGYTAAESLRAQPSPHEERKRQQQRSRSEVKAGAVALADRRSALIERHFITDAPDAVAAVLSLLPRVADAICASARARNVRANYVPGKRDSGKWSRCRRFITARW